MSRSRKKYPILGICCHSFKTHRKAKKRMVRTTRNNINDINISLKDGSFYKKWMHSWHWRPDDGKHFYDHETSYRK